MKPELDEKELVGAAKTLMGVKLGEIGLLTKQQLKAYALLSNLTFYEIAELIMQVKQEDK